LKLVLFHLITEPYVHHYTRPIYKLFRSRYIAPGATSREEELGARPPNREQRLSNAQAALALGQLRQLDKNLAHRRWAANAYRTRLLEHGLDIPQPPPKAEPAYVRYPICVEDREAVVRAVAPHAVLGKWWTSVVDGAAPTALGDYEIGSCPRAETVVKHLVNLPTHLRVGARDIEAIMSAVTRVALGARRL
jgi:dTDP-4-amino-4,6-dideoxygalactose transaminase